MVDAPDYGPILADMRRRRDELNRAIATIEAVSGLPPAAAEGDSNGDAVAGVVAGATGLRRDSFFGMKAPEAARTYLAIVRQPRTASIIAKDLMDHGFHSSSGNPSNIVRTALSRLAVDGEVVQVKNKEWGLTAWYPGLRNKRGKDKDREKESVESKEAGSSTRPRSAYHAFIAKKMGDGMTMKDAAAAYKAQKKG